MNDEKIYVLGFFDGVHRGHQALLDTGCQLARQQDCLAAAITFDRHPQTLFVNDPPALINSVSDREKLLRDFHMAHIRILPVTESVMGRSWDAFLQDLLADGAVGFVCGYDFRFGCKGEGNAQRLRAFCEERGLPCIIVPEQTLEGVRISSSHIRQLIEQGEMETAEKFLGHPHFLSGTVVAGRHLGRTIGVPTANILIPEDVVVPKLGVYACICTVDGQKFMAVTNIGSRPTVGGHQVRAESWILDFDGDLYGKEIMLEFVKFLRPERKFDSLEALKRQIQADAAAVRMLENETGPCCE